MPTSLNSNMPATEVGRELIRVAFKDTVRMNGVPANWLDCQVRTIPMAGGERIQIHLIMRKWSGHLLRYSLAFEKQLLQCLNRYEPDVDHTAYEWLWRYASDCDCPFPNMPPPAEWMHKADANHERQSGLQQTALPRGSIPAQLPVKNKQFDLNDVFSDLKPEDLRPRK